MTRTLFRPIPLLLLFLIASAIALLHLPAEHAWQDLDPDVGGLTPHQDCGWNFWRVFTPAGQPPCITDGRDAQPIVREAEKRVIEEHGEHETWLGQWGEWKDFVQGKVSEILEGISRSWSMP